MSAFTLKKKTNQQLRLLCKDRGLPQYGDKETLCTRILSQGDQSDPEPDDGDEPAIENVQQDYKKMKKDKLVFLMKERKIGGYSGKKKEDLVRRLVRHDEEMARMDAEKRTLNEDFGECQQCEDLTNIKHVMKAKFNCRECKLKICGPCEIAHVKTKATRHHMVEPLHKLNIFPHPIPGFAKHITPASTVETDRIASPSWVDSLERGELVEAGPGELHHLGASGLLGN
jgi:hypothetical protein